MRGVAFFLFWLCAYDFCGWCSVSPLFVYAGRWAHFAVCYSGVLGLVVSVNVIGWLYLAYGLVALISISVSNNLLLRHYYIILLDCLLVA